MYMRKMAAIYYFSMFLCVIFHSLCLAQPRVSIITSVYNGDFFIEQFLQDITRQSIFDQCELLLINANSPGHEEEIIKRYVQLYPNNIIYRRLDADPGLYGVWNLGIELAQSEYLTNANLDDRLAINCLEVLSAALDANPDIDLVYSDGYITTRPNELFENRSTQEVIYYAEFSLRAMVNCLPGSHPMWRKSMHKKYGMFDVRFKVAGDYEMWLRAAFAGSRFKKIPGIYGLYYCNPQGLSTNHTNGVPVQERNILMARYFGM